MSDSADFAHGVRSVLDTCAWSERAIHSFGRIPMSDSARPAITDSPWFWVLAFSLMALLALGVVGASGKYGKRQAKIERQYQARQRVAENLVAKDAPASEDASGEPTDSLATNRDYATPDNTLLPLWPLGAILAVVSIVALVMLLRGVRRTAGSKPA